MKKFKIILAALLCACGLQASAQEAGDTVTFNPHWFVSAHGGVQYTLGEAKFGDLLSPTVQVAAGYRFNPWLSARLSVGAWQRHRLRQRRGQRPGGAGLQPALQLGGHEGARRWPRRPRA